MTTQRRTKRGGQRAALVLAGVLLVGVLALSKWDTAWQSTVGSATQVRRGAREVVREQRAHPRGRCFPAARRRPTGCCCRQRVSVALPQAPRRVETVGEEGAIATTEQLRQQQQEPIGSTAKPAAAAKAKSLLNI